jgi:hypothetical protein
MTIDFTTFQEMEFPRHRDIVYVFHYVDGDGSSSIPFYVGESSRHVGRFGDYMSANFSASTDFKVGEAIKHLRKRGLRVVVKFRESHDRREDEKQILHELRKTVRLLNDLKGYRYGSADIAGERQKIHQFIDDIIENPFGTVRAIQSSTPLRHKATSTSMVSSQSGAPVDSNLSVPERVRLICQELAAEDKIIHRRDIFRIAKERGINEGSVLPADYCDNTQTGKWSKHSFLHSVGPGRYVLK